MKIQLLTFMLTTLTAQNDLIPDVFSQQRSNLRNLPGQN